MMVIRANQDQQTVDRIEEYLLAEWGRIFIKKSNQNDNNDAVLPEKRESYQSEFRI